MLIKEFQTRTLRWLHLNSNVKLQCHLLDIVKFKTEIKQKNHRRCILRKF